MPSDDYVHHPILAKPWTYQVVGFSFQVGEERSFTKVDLLLAKEGEQVRLRFHGVHEFEVEKGFPWISSGMVILDQSGRGMEDSRIQVSNFEQDPAIRFWARRVERIEPTGDDLE